MNPSARILKKAGRRVRWIIESLTWPVRVPFYRAMLSKCKGLDVCIGVTTYKDRFGSCLKPLLPKLFTLFPNEQIIIIANGHYRQEEQKGYLAGFTEFCNRFRNAETGTYIDPKGLSSLWNSIIRRSRSENILILNDDILISSGFRRLVEGALKGKDPVLTFNSSWSHFMIRKFLVNQIGFFDEGFREIGGEDDDYIARMALAGLRPGNVATSTLSGRSKRRMHIAGLNSYGRDMSKETGGYSTLNTEYLLEKWETSDEYFEGAVEVPGRKTRFWKLRDKQSI